VRKYVEYILHRAEWGTESCPYNSSRWWKDICALKETVYNNWFAGTVFRMVRNGALTSLWRDRRMGNTSFCELFTRLFSISHQRDAIVQD
jgi:hypothetical protein